MATWDTVKALVHAKYQGVSEQADGLLRMQLLVGNSRSQEVWLYFEHHDLVGDWLSVASPIGRVGEVDITEAARITWNQIAGGIVVVNDIVFVRNSMPMANLDENELDLPLEIVTVVADGLEQTLLNRDLF